MGIGSNRYQVGRRLEAIAPLETVILDDGFQHVALERDIDLVLIDVTNPFGDGAMIPLGHLREPLSGLARASAFVLTRTDADGIYEGIKQRLKQWNPQARIFTSRLESVEAVFAGTEEVAPLDALRKRRAVAFCGLGNPDSFWRDLENLGIILAERIRFPDHHRYSSDDVERIVMAAEQRQAHIVISTEKDIVNLVHAIGPEAIDVEAMEARAVVAPGADPEQRSKQALDTHAARLFGSTPLAWMRVRTVVDQGHELLDWIERQMPARMSSDEEPGPQSPSSHSNALGPETRYAKPDDSMRLLVRTTNWLGDAVMSIPALREIRGAFPEWEITLLARPWVADLYAREDFCDHIVHYENNGRHQGLLGKWTLSSQLRQTRFDCAVLLQNAFDAALVAWLARIPRRIGYARDARGLLLTQAVAVPAKGQLPAHERFYYLELLRRAGLIEHLPDCPDVRLSGASRAAESGWEQWKRRKLAAKRWIGVSPGAAYGGAKRWLPERFAEAATALASELDADIAVFGSQAEAEVCGRIADLAGSQAHNLAGTTSLAEFIDLAATCTVYLTNDSGPMHVAAASGFRPSRYSVPPITWERGRCPSEPAW